ncbi:hypothetical protein LIER_13620 [Lithospermum erythrorhizon]|uniref:Uncharacterized protein n=1 Tax=Lithospermum erythrorhizon TaxID=34254 RepID=A0AAV3Q0P7_LITER
MPPKKNNLGINQAQQAGSRIVRLLTNQSSSSSSSSKTSVSCSIWNAYYVSPYDRTSSTLREMRRAFPMKKVIGVREECRIREQDFGNFQVAEKMKTVK